MTIEAIAILNYFCATAVYMAACYRIEARAKGWPVGTVFARPSAVLLVPLASAFITSIAIIPVALFPWWSAFVFLFGGAPGAVLLTSLLRKLTQIISLLLCAILPPILWYGCYIVKHGPPQQLSFAWLVWLAGVSRFLEAAVFASFAFGLFFEFSRSKHRGVFFAAVTYGAASFLAFYLASWWPLLIGFILAWLLRLLGGDPGYDANSE